MRPEKPSRVGLMGTEVRPVAIKANTEDKTVTHSSDQLAPVKSIGQVALNWLNLVNSHRDADHRLNLSDKTEKHPAPMEKPIITSVKSILDQLAAETLALPAELKSVLLENKDIVEAPSTPDEIFLKHIRKINALYQSAIRWPADETEMMYYKFNSFNDIRGYYFLKNETSLDSNLKNFQSLESEKKQSYSSWLSSLCHNSWISIEKCKNELAASVEEKKVFEYYSKYLSDAEKVYSDYFKAEHRRSDLKWDPTGVQLTQDFILPTLPRIADWLKENIEDEWKGAGFQLKLNLVANNQISPFIQFEKNVIPNVSGPTRNLITMDPDYALDDQLTRLVIRHEFGHVLGFPDCYVEFYDENTQEMIYYSIEPDNIMCAWGGKVKPSHIEELRRVYQ